MTAQPPLGRTFGATIPSGNLERSRRFYEDVLGAIPRRQMEGEVVYRLGSGEFDVTPRRTPAAPSTRSGASSLTTSCESSPCSDPVA